MEQRKDPPVTSRDVLETLTFGRRIAEEERELLGKYFVATDQWRQVRAGDADIVYGAKGSGKSALYFLLLDHESDFRASGIELITAENPRGATVFKDLATEPPAKEREFIDLWKLYFLSLLGRVIKHGGDLDDSGAAVVAALEEIGLLESAGGLKGLLRTVRDYVRRFSGIEGGVSADAFTGTPTLTGKLLFENPSQEQRSAGAVSVDDLFEAADRSLAQAGKQAWVLLDRLDVAFAETPELEQNALRALFKAYLDLQGYERLKLKIFLRTDIWRRLTSAGLREASHITRTVTIGWNRSSLLNLIIRRSLQHPPLRDFYGIQQDANLNPSEQEALFYRMFPEQVDSGPNKPSTLDWLLSRVQDGTRQPAPRELIHLLNSIRDVQYRKLELNEPEAPSNQLFTRVAIKEGLPEVSTVRLEQTLYAEYPSLKEKCEQLRGAKTQQSPETLSAIWNIDPDAAVTTARSLVDVGFFEERGTRDKPEFWVPFLYREALEMVQGTAAE